MQCGCLLFQAFHVEVFAFNHESGKEGVEGLPDIVVDLEAELFGETDDLFVDIFQIALKCSEGTRYLHGGGFSIHNAVLESPGELFLPEPFGSDVVPFPVGQSTQRFHQPLEPVCRLVDQRRSVGGAFKQSNDRPVVLIEVVPEAGSTTEDGSAGGLVHGFLEKTISLKISLDKSDQLLYIKGTVGWWVYIRRCFSLRLPHVQRPSFYSYILKNRPFISPGII